MDISEILFDYQVPFSTKHAILDLMERESISYDMPVLKPTAANDDVNGSQHASNGGNDFTYEDAELEDVLNGSALGYYEYFGTISTNYYTGHSYHGSDSKFAAVVIDPPAYAATVQI